METLDQEDVAQTVVGPALPPPSQKSEFLEKNDLEYEVVNGIPCYSPGHVINGQVQVFERIGYDDNVGGTFLGLGAAEKELVIRVAPIDATTHVVRAEAAFLCKVEAYKDDWRHFSQVHKIFMTDDAFHLTLYFRGGPTLEQCFALRNKFTYGTAGRLANDVLNIIQCAHKHGYLLRNLNMDCFHYDAASRHLFQADISSLVKNVSPNEPITFYAGSLDYAPLASHNDERIGARHDLEAWFYQLMHMVLGELPWGASSRREAKIKKMRFRKSEQFSKMPEKFHEIANIVFSEAGTLPTEAEYAQLSKLTEQIYTELGGVTDYEENMDFEREPTPDEIPRLVMCRDDELEPVQEDDEEKETAEQ